MDGSLWLEGGVRFVTLAGTTLAIGGFMARAWLPALRPADARLARVAAGGCLLLVLGCFLQGSRILWSLSEGDMALAKAMLPALAGSATGRLVSARLVLVILLLVRQQWRPPGTLEATCWSLLLAFSLAWDSHAGDFKGAMLGLSLGADTLHALLAASWLGGLLVLLGTQRKIPDPAAALRRFSTLAGFAMPGVLLTGALNAYLHLPRAGLLGLGTFLWGQLLVLKLVLVLCVLRLALGLRRQTGRLEAAALPAATRRGVCVEAVLGLLILGVTGLLSQTNPMPEMQPTAPAATMPMDAP